MPRPSMSHLSTWYPEGMEPLRVEIDREEDGRWIAEVTQLPGVMVYGETRDQAVAKVEALALRVLAEQLEQGASPAAASLFAVAV